MIIFVLNMHIVGVNYHPEEPYVQPIPAVREE